MYLFVEVIAVATLKDIAKACHVSVSTVSRVLNDDQTLNVSDLKRSNIIKTAQKMNYVKKHKNLRDKKHIAVVLWYDTNQEMEDPYYMEIRHGIEQQAKEKNIYIMTLYKQHDTYDYQALKDVDGLIALGKFTSEEVRAFEDKTNHIVFVDSVFEPTHYDSVVIDFDQAMDSLFNHIKQHAYQSIGYIGGYEPYTQQSSVLEPRANLLKHYLIKTNQYDAKHMHFGTFVSQSGYQLMQQAIQDGNVAGLYICANDSIAFGAIKALLENDMNIPDDVSIIGFNDIAQAAYIHPSLTTVKIHTSAMGKEALSSLLDRINDPDKIPIKKVLPTNLIVRQSSKKGAF